MALFDDLDLALHLVELDFQGLAVDHGLIEGKVEHFGAEVELAAFGGCFVVFLVEGKVFEAVYSFGHGRGDELLDGRSLVPESLLGVGISPVPQEMFIGL